MAEERVGVIGLGAMGGPIAARLAAAGHALVGVDTAGSAERLPPGAVAANSTAEVVRRAGVVFLSLPDGAAVSLVAREIAGAGPPAGRLVVDLSTIGIAVAEAVARSLAAAGIAFLDAPVSGGVQGARAGSLAVMAAGARESFERARPILAAFAKNVFHVGERPGQGQAMKLLNNFLSATAMAATSEAVTFGEAHGLDLALMISVLNASTGRNTATSDKFPKRVLSGSYDAGFKAALMAKDVRLYHEAVREAGTSSTVGGSVAAVLERFGRATPEADFTRLYPFMRGRG